MTRLHAPSHRARRAVAVVAVALVGAVTLAACYPITSSPYQQYLLFDGATPPTPSVSDTKSVELGVRFRSSKDGAVLGVRFYKGAGNTGTHTGTLWSNSGTKLASVTFTDETPTGWQTAAFASPVSITAGTTYVVSYHAPVGRYAHGTGWFSSPHVNGPLTAPASTASNPNSVYRYGTSVAFPTSTNAGSNYYVEPVFTDLTVIGAEPTTTAKPTSTTAKPTTTTAKPTTTTTTPPSGGSFPTPQSTGWARTGVTLSAYTGPSTITTAGTVIDGKDITSCLTIRAKNVTIKRSRVRCAGSYGIIQNSNSQGLLVEDVEITSGGSGLVDRAIAFTDGATLRRAYIHNTQRGIAVGSNTTVEYSYVGDNSNGTSAHSSAIMTSGGTRHVVVRGNTLQTRPNTNASSAISFYPELWAGGANDDFLIEGNLLNSGGAYAVYLGHTPSAGESPNTNFRFVNNRFGTLYYPNCGSSGPVASWSNHASNTWSGNTWYDLRPTTGSYTNKDGRTVNP